MNYFYYVFLFVLPSTIFSKINSGKRYFVYNEAYDRTLLERFRSATTADRPTDHAKVARTLVHKADWGAAGTISSNENIKGFPMVNIISISDSKKNAKSSGKIYFMLTDLDFTGQDTKEDNKITFMISQDEDLSCQKNNDTDPMEPICARVIISGKVVILDKGAEEYKFGFESFVSRHPAAWRWIEEHTFYLCVLDIENIYVLDWYGGPHTVTPDEYYQAEPDSEYEAKYHFREKRNYKEIHIKIQSKQDVKKIQIEL